MTMIAKFDGRCKDCGGPLRAGTQISWTREHGARHTASVECDRFRATQTAQTIAAAQAAPVLGAFVSILAFLTGAKANGLKFPKARFLAPNGGEMRLSIAGELSKHPGTINVTIDSAWIGRIGLDGGLSLRSTVGPIDGAAVTFTLETIAANPAAAAKAYGAMMCRCSFCNLALTDAGSVEAGYGPVCADKWNLPHTAKGTPALSAVAA